MDFQLTVCALIMEFREGPLDIHSLNIQSIVLISLGIPFCLLFAIIGYKAVKKGKFFEYLNLNFLSLYIDFKLRMESCKLTIIFTICHILIPIFVVYQIYEVIEIRIPNLLISFKIIIIFFFDLKDLSTPG